MRFYHSYNEQGNCFFARDEEGKSRLIEFVRRENLIKFAKPCYLNANGHDQQSLKQTRILIYYMVIMFIYSLHVVTWFIYVESKSRATLRCKLFHCKLLDEHATILQDPYKMWSDPETDILQQIMHWNRNESCIETDCVTWSQLAVELSQMIKLPTVSFYSTLLAINYFNCCATVFATLFWFADGLLYKHKWLDHVHRQLIDCICLLEELNNIELLIQREDSLNSHYYCAKSMKNRQDMMSNDGCCFRRKQLQKALIITYLNFELFRDEYQQFKQFCSITILQNIPIPLLNTILCASWTGSSFSKHLQMDIYIPLIDSIVYISYLNAFVLFCDHLVKKIQDMYKKVDILVTKLSLNSMQLEYIHELWTKQLLSETDVNQAYCPQIFGNYLNSSTLIGVDSYAFALWLVVSRYFYAKQDSLYEV